LSVPDRPQPPGVLRALFIGNSFTARNDVPGLIARMAERRGRSFEHALVSRGGASLRAHWNKGEARRELAGRRFDIVVLQEQSTLPVKNAVRFHENVRLFDPVIREHGARVVLYMTWARQHEPHNQRVLADAYNSIGEQIAATVAPVGLAWEKVLAMTNAPQLHDRDMSHPNLAGSYLAACVLYATLFDDCPEGLDLPVDGLGDAVARLMHSAAWEQVLLSRRRK